MGPLSPSSLRTTYRDGIGVGTLKEVFCFSVQSFEVEETRPVEGTIPDVIGEPVGGHAGVGQGGVAVQAGQQCSIDASSISRKLLSFFRG